MNKKFYLLFAAIAAVSCTETEPQLHPEIPVYPVTVPVKSATATSAGAVCQGVIDNDAHTIWFGFDAEGVNLSAVSVKLEYSHRAVATEFVEETVVDLTKPYAFTVNNAVEDISFTMSAGVVATTTPVIEAYAVSSVAGNIYAEVDNASHKISFDFSAGSVTLSAVPVVIIYSPRSELKTGAFTEATIDLTSPYTFVCTDGVNDLTYTITGAMSMGTLVPNTECSVVKGIAGACPASDPENIAAGAYKSTDAGGNLLNDPANLFDGVWMSKAEAYTEVGYRYFGQGFVTEDYSTWFVFDIGSKAKVEKIVIWPYYPYSQGQCPWKYELYAFVGEGEVGAWSASSADWKKVAEDDLTEWYYEQKAVEESKDTLYGTESDHCTTGRTVEFDAAAPSAQYYCYHMSANMFSLGQSDLFPWWTGRTRAMMMSEIQVYAY